MRPRLPVVPALPALSAAARPSSSSGPAAWMSSEGPASTHPVWPRLSAVRNRRVYMTDGNQYFNRPGPRVVESAEILDVLHPDHCDFGHHGRGWTRWTADAAG